VPPQKDQLPAGAIRALRSAGSPEARCALAIDLVARSRDLEVLRAALAVLAEEADPSLRPMLHEKYDWCEASPVKRDSSGFIRSGIVRALGPIVQPADAPLLRRALTTYQMQGMYELCAELRAAALVAMAELDPDQAGLFAARFLTDPLTSFSGEPALTAIQTLVAQGRLEPVFALASWEAENGQLVGEALRNLVDLDAELVDLLVERHLASDDPQVSLGVFDLLLGHRDRLRWHDTILRSIVTSDDLDIYGIVVTSIVASRDEHLIRALRALAADERDRTKRQLLDHALEHA
jgi:hypothetical protein